MERIAETNRRLALTDPLTSLPNRRHLERHLDQALAHAVFAAFHQAGARLRPFSLVLFDVDDFKRLNERHGYVAGDRVLATVGAVLSRVCPNACPALTARLGGDEFVAILPGKATDQARKAARRMAEAVARDPALSSQGVTVSFGVAAPDATMRHHRELLAAADRDLHRRRAARSRPARRSPGHSPRAGAPHILVRRSRADCPNPRSSRDRAHHVTPGTSAMTPSRRNIFDLQELERSAEEFARAAGEIALGYFRTRIEVDTKADGTPVTIADREAESRLRAEIRRRFPDHGIVGEEHGEVLPGAPVRWILDPIDGTKSFVHGVPLWGRPHRHRGGGRARGRGRSPPRTGGDGDGRQGPGVPLERRAVFGFHREPAGQEPRAHDQRDRHARPPRRSRLAGLGRGRAPDPRVGRLLRPRPGRHGAGSGHGGPGAPPPGMRRPCSPSSPRRAGASRTYRASPPSTAARGSPATRRSTRGC